MGLTRRRAPTATALSFTAATQAVASAVEARWPRATAVVVWHESKGATAMCGGTKVDLGPAALDRDAELLDSLAQLLPRRAASRIRHAGDVARAAIVPMLVEGERVGVLLVFGLPASARSNTPELLGTFASLLATIRHLEVRAEELARDAEGLRLEARTDSVTGLPNRRGFLDLLEAHCAHAGEADHGDMLVLAVVHGIMTADDRYGYAAGDHLLCHVAEVLDTTSRAQDRSGRVGHDQFAVILCGDHPADRVPGYVERVQRELARRAGERPVDVIVEFGARSLAGLKSPEHALQRTDEAMFERPLDFLRHSNV
jgi:diguanylate cyclase (GGDEF)-like protein